MKKSKILIIVLSVLVVCGLGAVLFFLKIQPAIKTALQKDVSHQEGALNITLPKEFTKVSENAVTGEWAYMKSNVVVSGICSKNDFLKKNHYDVESSIEYAKVYVSQHGTAFTSEIYDDQPFPYVETEEKSGETYYKSLIAFYKGSDGYYNIYFTCPELDYEMHRADFIKWANTVIMN